MIYVAPPVKSVYVIVSSTLYVPASTSTDLDSVELLPSTLTVVARDPSFLDEDDSSSDEEDSSSDEDDSSSDDEDSSSDEDVVVSVSSSQV